MDLSAFHAKLFGFQTVFSNSLGYVLMMSVQRGAKRALSFCVHTHDVRLSGAQRALRQFILHYTTMSEGGMVTIMKIHFIVHHWKTLAHIITGVLCEQRTMFDHI